jgi:ABC-type uncharacterized transport system permease subunit
VIIYVLSDGKPTIHSKLKPINTKNFDNLVMWILYYCPFHMSTMSDSSVEIWRDAYTNTAYQKLLIPFNDNPSLLPDTVDNILDRTTPLDRKLRKIIWVLLFVFVLCFTFLAIYNFVVSEDRIEFLVQGIAICLPLLMFSFIVIFLSSLFTFIRSKFSSTNEEGKSN